MISKENIKKNSTFLGLLFYSSLSLLAFRKVLFIEGSLGYKGDWSLPYFNEQYKNLFISKLLLVLPDGSIALKSVGQHIIQPILCSMSFFGANGDLITKLFFIFFFGFAGFTMCFFLRKTFNFSNFASLFSGSIYMMNPITFNMIVMGHHKMLFSYSLFPLFLYFFYRMIIINNHKNALLCGIFIGFVLSQEHYIMVLFFFNVLYWIFHYRSLSFKKINNNILAWMVGILIQAPFFFLQMIQIGETSHELKSATIHWTWFHSPTFLETLLFKVPTHHYLSTLNGLNMYTYALIASIAFLIIAISAVLIKKNHTCIFYLSIVVFSLLIYTGPNAPFSNLTVFLYDEFPFIFSFFRTTSRIGLLIIPALSVLIAVSITYVGKLKINNQIPIYLILLLLFVIFSVGFYTGDFGFGYNKSGVISYTLPSEYHEMYNTYLGKDTNYRVLMIPMTQPMKYPNNDKGHGHDPLLRGAITPYIGDGPKNQLAMYLVMMLHSPAPKNLSHFLGKYSIKYVIYRKDFKSVIYKFSYPCFPKHIVNNNLVYENLIKEPGFNVVEENDHYIIFENENCNPLIYSSMNKKKFNSFFSIEDYQAVYTNIDFNIEETESIIFQPNHTNANKGWASFDSWYFWGSNYLSLPKKAIFTLQAEPKLSSSVDINGKYDVYLNVLPYTENQITSNINGNSQTENINESMQFNWIYLGNYDFYNVSSISFQFSKSPIAVSQLLFAKHPINFSSYNDVSANSLDMSTINKLNIQEEYPDIIFKKINPTKYKIKIENSFEPFYLTLSESYHPQWKAYPEDKEIELNEITASYDRLRVKEARHELSFTPRDISYLFKKPLSDDNHLLVNGYANAWYIDPKVIDKDGDGNFTVTLYLLPQSLLYLGLFISGMTFICCLGYLLCDWRRNKDYL
jgi:hypothetical protein